MDNKTDIKEIAERITTRNDLIVFLNKYYNQYLNNPGLWKTEKLESFFESMSQATRQIAEEQEQTDGSNSEPHPTWRTVADILMRARDIDPKSP